MKKFNCYFRFWPSLITILIVSLFCHLGHWQWQRYHEKKNWMTSFKKNQLLPQIFKPGTRVNQFEVLIVAGTLDKTHWLLLENQLRDDGPGCEIFGVLKLKQTRQKLLINLGWLHQSECIDWHPNADLLALTHFKGYAKWPDNRGFILGDPILNPGKWPLKLQHLDLSLLSNTLQTPLVPFVLRLYPEASSPYRRDWQISNVSPERHLGYSIQWFTMALVLCVIFFYFCRKKRP